MNGFLLGDLPDLKDIKRRRRNRAKKKNRKLKRKQWMAEHIKNRRGEDVQRGLSEKK